MEGALEEELVADFPGTCSDQHVELGGCGDAEGTSVGD